MLASKHSKLALTIALALASPMPLMAQSDSGEENARELDRIVVTGTRVAGRSATDTAAPLDVVGVQSLERTGSPELNQALSVALPSFNFPRPGLADGTDTIRPATLRGLSPDQSLVLVNSKRRHSSALVNVNGTIGRGAAAVDLNTIPTAAVQSIEVLRDGASAQYGSDAIAGVLNVLLREASEGGSASVTYGVRETSYTTPVTPGPAGANWLTPATITRDRSDGETVTVSAWQGFGLGDDGYVTLSAEYKDQQRTERGGYDFRQQYPRVNNQFDPREASIDRFNAWYGEPDLEQLTLFGNAGINLASGGKLYAWASYQGREADSAGFFRRALDERNVIEIYPDGFLPIISPSVDDYSFALGYQWNTGEWDMDASLGWGRNEMAFTINNTLNRSLGPSSKTSFNAGGFDYDQLVLNLSGVRSVDVSAFSSPLNVAVGIEGRKESYSIFAGEPDSYRNGGVLLPNGTPTASGAQVFPGFRPSNEVDEDRQAIGLYVDFEANITDKLLGSAAVRMENYSDFGFNSTGKLALRYDFTDSFALRGSAQTGFRAPSVQQQFFTATSTNFINGIPFDITTFPVNSAEAIALGARDLEPEESVNFSLGAVFNIGSVSLTIDAYRIDIDDRIVLSENLTAANVRQFLESRGFVGIGGGRFFINGVDTETQGVDVVLNWPLETAGAGQFDFTLLGNMNDTKVTRVPVTAPLAALSPAPVLFGRVNVLTFEEGTPKDKFAGIVDWSMDRFGATFRATRYGEVLVPGTTAASDFVLSPKVLLDLEARVNFNEQWRLAVGAENLTDEYPDALTINLNTTGNTPYSNYSPFGRSGRLLYVRLNYDF